MKYKLIIFDMDGTILNTLDDLTNSLNQALRYLNYPVKTKEEVKSYVGNGMLELVRLGLPNGTSEEKVLEVFEYFKAFYKLHCMDLTNPYEGMLELIQKLLKENGLVAVVSNKEDYAVQILCDKYFKGIFDYSVGLTNNIRKKPYPDTVIKVLEKFNIDYKDAVYIGDTEVDIETAKNANIDCISVDWGFRDKKALIRANATNIVSNIDELYKALK